MRILYAIQGTGNGHLSRARDIIPLLKQKGHLDILISGSQSDVDLPYKIKYRFEGLSFTFGKKGGVNLLDTFRKSNIRKLLSEIRKLDVDQYDLVISDFEPVSAWACRFRDKTCVGLSHQAAVMNPYSPKPLSGDPLGKAILQYYAPVSHSYGFHFQAYAEQIHTPVIRKQVRESEPQNNGHYTVYLPAYDDKKIIKVLSQIDVEWEVFSKHSKKKYKDGNVIINPINNEEFINSMIKCSGVLCGAGFETPAEAMYLRKNLLVIPMNGQYEQQCNAAALKAMGVDVIKSLKSKHVDHIKTWTESGKWVEVDFPDQTRTLIAEIVKKHAEPERAHELFL